MFIPWSQSVCAIFKHNTIGAIVRKTELILHQLWITVKILEKLKMVSRIDFQATLFQPSI